MDGCSSEWSYFTPYEADISVALQRLREDVFARGDFVIGHGFPKSDMAELMKQHIPIYEVQMKEFIAKAEDTSLSEHDRFLFREVSERMKSQLVEYRRELAEASSPLSKQKPKTIEELLKQQAEIGTHSILDITRVSPTPKRKAVSPLPDAVLADYCLSGTPSREEIEDVYEFGSLEKYVTKRWRGIYIIAYTNAKPSEIFFAGCSGD